jgi:hypothetical protein
VCTNVEYTYTAEVVRYYVFGVIANTTYEAQGTVPADVTLTGVGAAGIIRTRFFGGASFRRTFPAAGTYTLRATATGVASIAGGNVGSIDPATAVVTARSCDYELTALSIWYHLPYGFQPWIGGVIDPVLLRPDASGSYRATGHLRTFALAEGPCSPTFDVQDVDVVIVGAIRSSGTTFAYSIDYTPGKAVTHVTCPKAGSASSRLDDFSVDTISDFLPRNPLGGVAVGRESPHVVHAGADVNGVTYVILTPLP